MVPELQLLYEGFVRNYVSLLLPAEDEGKGAGAHFSASLFVRAKREEEGRSRTFEETRGGHSAHSALGRKPARADRGSHSRMECSRLRRGSAFSARTEKAVERDAPTFAKATVGRHVFTALRRAGS